MLDLVQKFLCFTTLIVALFVTTQHFHVVAMSPYQDESVSTLVLSSEIDTTWRHTREGWQDTSHWSSEDTFVPQPFAELIHPLVWTGLVLLAVIVLMVWASSEKEVARLMGDKDRSRLPEIASTE